MVRAAAVACIALLAGAAQAATAPATMPSVVFQAPGQDHQMLTRRATSCIPRTMTSGLTTAPVIIASDPELGAVEARNFVPGGPGPDYRSQVTVEAKDGRFRISHHDVEIWFGRRWMAIKPEKMTAALAAELNAQSEKVADCILKGPVGDGF